MKLAPIVLFVYNRPWHTKQTIEALQKNELASDSELFIYSDAPKNGGAQKAVEEVRVYLKTIDGFKMVHIVERETNWGLAKSIIDGVTTVINQYGKIIVLEDDLVTSPYFLKFMNDNLKRYENAKKVASIHGYIYPIDDLPKTFFIKGADCWGWATWKDRWNMFEPDGRKLLKSLKKKDLLYEADFNGSYPYVQMLKDQINGRNDSWAIRWYMSMFLENMLTLYPGQSYVQNIGMGIHATHCQGETDAFDIILNNTYTPNEITIEENMIARKAIESYFKTSKKRGFLKKIIFLLRNIIH